MPLDHRLPAICTAVFSSVGVLLAAFSGSSCNFLLRISDDEEENIFNNEFQDITSSFGVLCEHEIFPRDGDRMWELSRIFLICGLSFGSLTAALAWAVATFLTPTDSNWNGISVLAAITAVIQVPIFVLFEAEPCIGDMEDIDLLSDSTTGMGCELGPASYLLISSELFFIAVTVLNQCFDRPKWGLELELWKVHKRGESKPKSKRGKESARKNSRNDEYYYDDNENYDDAMRLTSHQARSLVDSDGDDENAFYKISRILPAGEANQSKESEAKKNGKKPLGIFAKLFGKPSSTDNLEVPLSKTQSIDEYDYESNLLHNLEIIRVLPQVDASLESPTQPSQSPSPTTISGEGEEVSIGAFGRIASNVSRDSSKRDVQNFDAVVDDGNARIPWMPPASASGNGIASPLVEQHQMIDSPGTSLLCMENNGEQQPVVSSVTDILQDLRCEEIANEPSQLKQAPSFAAATAAAASPAVVPQAPLESPRIVKSPTPAEQVVQGVKQLTKKFKSEGAKRQGVASSLRNLGIFARKNAYCQMASDQSDSDFNTTASEGEESKDNYFNYYNEQGMKAPSGSQMNGIQINYSQETPTAANISGFSEGIQEDDISHIYDDLNRETEEVNSIVQKAKTTSIDAFAPFETMTIGSTHSDPGPISFFGGETGTNFTPIFTTGSGGDDDGSFTDLIKLRTNDIHWDNEFAAEDLSDDDDDDDAYFREQPTRGRSSERNDGRRRRRPGSPVGSIKSHTSLLELTIEEETEEDVKNELDPNYTYTLKRTLSSPEMRSVVRPISSRRDRSTNELLKKLERLKHTINVDNTQNNNQSERPPLRPRKDVRPEISTKSNTITDGSFVSMDDNSEASSKKDDASAILSDLLRTQSRSEDDANVGEPSSLPKVNHIERSEGQGIAETPSVPAKLETSENDSWREQISPMKDTPSKERLNNLQSPVIDMPPAEKWTKPGTPGTMDISDETSETGHTRSTYDSDDSSEGEAGRKRIRSKSMGRMIKHKKTENYRSSRSVSPSRRRTFSEGSSSCLPANISNIARESRIRRLQQLRKGYMPLDNYNDSPESPKPYKRDLYDPADDPELTPKRKTAVPNDRDELMSAASSTELTNDLFQPSLLDPEQPCPEFDNILDHLDLQLIDLNRPIGAEYGADEGSM